MHYKSRFQTKMNAIKLNKLAIYQRKNIASIIITHKLTHWILILTITISLLRLDAKMKGFPNYNTTQHNTA